MDKIENLGSNAIINSGNGADSIVSQGDNVTINAGTGNDVVYNLSSNETIQVARGNIDSIYAEKDGDIIIKVNSGNIRLHDKAGQSINIQYSTGKVTTKSYTYTRTLYANSYDADNHNY